MAGNNNVHRGPAKDKRFRAALIRYADAEPDRLDRLAEKLWLTAMEGDTPALKEIADRLDGKVPQGIGGDDELGPVQLEHIERTIVDPKNTDSESI